MVRVSRITSKTLHADLLKKNFYNAVCLSFSKMVRETRTKAQCPGLKLPRSLERG